MSQRMQNGLWVLLFIAILCGVAVFVVIHPRYEYRKINAKFDNELYAAMKGTVRLADVHNPNSIMAGYSLRDMFAAADKRGADLQLVSESLGQAFLLEKDALIGPATAQTDCLRFLELATGIGRDDLALRIWSIKALRVASFTDLAFDVRRALTVYQDPASFRPVDVRFRISWIWLLVFWTVLSLGFLIGHEVPRAWDDSEIEKWSKKWQVFLVIAAFPACLIAIIINLIARGVDAIRVNNKRAKIKAKARA